MCWVPFTIVSPNLTALWSGMLIRDEHELRFDLKVTDPNIGLGSIPKRITVPVKDLTSVELMKGWRNRQWQGITLVVRTRLASKLRDLPGASSGQIALTISRSNSLLAEVFVDELFCQGAPPL
jgi:hypothetical protein